MQTRRQFLHAATAAPILSCLAPVAGAQIVSPPEAMEGDRAFWVRMLARVAEPVLANLAENQLKAVMPVEAPASKDDSRDAVTHLEALGRTLTGVAPWLELLETEKPPKEAEASRRFGELARRAIANATNPEAPDFLNFTKGSQPLVDAAFLAHAFLRAPRELWQKLEPPVRTRAVACLRQTRAILPSNSNWLLFSAMIETTLAAVGGDWQETPIERALTSHEAWYKGDGAYGDGPEFHWDYYNSFVIQPMLLDVLEHMGKVTDRWSALRSKVEARARRYAAVLERLIAPDGSFPPLGRSLAYRCGAFQLLAQMALRRQLPDEVSPAQVRSALTAVIRRTLGTPGTFDDQGWLRIGVAGHQPSLAESYISTGSLYLCCAAFLPLGLPPEAPFWKEPAADWTQRKLWSGKDLPTDQALKVK